MKTSQEILDEIYQALHSVEKTLKTMSTLSKIKPESKGKISQNLNAISFFHEKVKKLALMDIQVKNACIQR